MSRALNQSIFNPAKIDQLTSDFQSARPYRHLIIDDFLDPEFARAINRSFPSIDSMKTHYSGLNEKKSEHSNFEKLPPEFVHLHDALSSTAFKNWVQACTGVADLETVDDRLGYGLHQGSNGSFLDIHIDYNIHPLKKVCRKLNLIIFFNEQWRPQWGGQLEMWDREVKQCITKVEPVFNRAIIFECSDISFHGYSKISVPEGVTRKSYYHYYFVKAGNTAAFHDTIFKPTPEENLLKHLLTPVKEYSKNAVKKLLLRIGLKKYLK